MNALAHRWRAVRGRVGVAVDVITFGVCASYVTLGLANAPQARALWAPYAAVTFLLAVIALVADRRHK